MKRKLLIVVALVAMLVAGLTVAVASAPAQQRTLLVTLLGGKTVTVTVDVPPGTPLDQIKIPGITVPIIAISEPNPPPPTTTTSTTPTVTTKTGTTHTGTTHTGTTHTQTTHQQTSSTSTGIVKPSGPAPAPKPRKKPAAPSRHTKEKLKGPKKQVGGGGDLQAQAKPRSKKPYSNGGVPNPSNPTFSLASPGAAPLGVPNFFIDRFRIPPFLLPIYQAAGVQYGIPWQVLAGINEIETDYGRNLAVSSAGAVGWMQFLPATWSRYGVDANGDGQKDPYNPVDAIFGAARYLKAAGGDKNVSKGIFAYNHADWYVQSVLLRARLIGGIPDALVGSLTGLTQGHFPVAAKARYADDLNTAHATRRVHSGNAAIPILSDAHRRGIRVFAKRKAPVIAVQDGKIDQVGSSKRLGRFIVLEDVYGNRYTYGHLGSVSRYYAVPKPTRVAPATVRAQLKLPKPDAKPKGPATAGVQRAKPHAIRAAKKAGRRSVAVHRPRITSGKERLFAHPARPAALAHGGRDQIVHTPSFSTFKDYFTVALGLKRRDVRLKPLKKGAQVIAGTILGRIGKTEATYAPNLYFEIHPAGKGAPRIDPKPILDGWKLLEATAIYRAAGKNPFFGRDAKDPTIGQVLLMSKEALERRVLADPKIDIYQCGRQDVAAGAVDRRVLATLEFLVASGLNPTVSALKCGHSYLTTSGNVSEHSSGDAVDIARVNGIPIVGHQGPGTITDITIRRLLTLQGTMKPHQIISLMTFPGTDNTLSMPDHYNHIHIGYHPTFDPNSKLGRQLAAILKPGQWLKLIDRLNQIPNPAVRVGPSRYSLPDKGHGSSATHAKGSGD